MKILLMSGFAATEIEKAEHSFGDIDLLTKPFTRTVIARKIRAQLEP